MGFKNKYRFFSNFGSMNPIYARTCFIIKRLLDMWKKSRKFEEKRAPDEKKNRNLRRKHNDVDQIFQSLSAIFDRFCPSIFCDLKKIVQFLKPMFGFWFRCAKSPSMMNWTPMNNSQQRWRRWGVRQGHERNVSRSGTLRQLNPTYRDRHSFWARRCQFAFFVIQSLWEGGNC